MSGTKTITNNSGGPISVVLRGRVGADPHNGSLPPVSASIPANQSVQVTYGNDQNPYLNSLQVEESSNGSDVSQSYVCLARGGPGTLDNLFNANSTLVLTYSAGSYGYTLAAHN